MRDVTLTHVYQHYIAKKYLHRSGIVHALSVSYHCFHLAKTLDIDVDLATKAGFLHDIGHFTWYRNGKWDYNLYKENDIHAIKGAERAHKLLIRLGENPKRAKEIALAILFHTDSFLPSPLTDPTPLQQIVKQADERDEEPSGMHHYRTLSEERILSSLKRLDYLVDAHMHS